MSSKAFRLARAAGFRGTGTLPFLLCFTTNQCLSWFLRISLCGGEWWVIFIFCLSRSRVDSSEDVNHQHRVKRGEWPCLSHVISCFPLLPHDLKNRGTKRRILNILNIAHEKFTWSAREIPQVGRYGGHKWQKCLAQGFGCMRSIPSQCKVFL